MNFYQIPLPLRLGVVALTWTAISCCSPTFAQDKPGFWEADDKHTVVHQFYKTYPEGLPQHDEDDGFRGLVESKCGGESINTKSISVGAILLDWIAGRAIGAANKKLDRYIKEHTATYSTTPIYSDIGDHRLCGARTVAGQPVPEEPESCVLVTRFHCPKNSFPRTNWAGCTTHLRFALLMRDQEAALRVLPIALSINGLEARHSKGKASVGVNFEIHAISPSIRGGQRWTSGDTPLVAQEIKAEKANPKSGEFGLTEELIEFPINDVAWNSAAVLPMPPGMKRPNTDKNQTLATFKVTIAEVGRPNAFGRRLADLLSAREDDLAGALGSALKKAADIKEE